jgi:hypothetical protein
MKVPEHPSSFHEFLSDAKKSTYASLTGRIESAVSGAKEHEFIRDDFRYVDIYFGSLQFSGIEIVYLRDKPMWTMTYSGGMIRNKEKAEVVYAFLRRALLRPDPDVPVRGPRHLAEGEYTYNMSAEGNLGRFSGRETVGEGSENLYSLDFAGGFVY